MIAATCPQRERLTEYVLGRLDVSAHEAVDTHVDECPACRSLVEALDRTTPPVLDGLRTPLPEESLDENSFRRLVKRVKAIVPGSSLELTSSVVGPVLGNYELLEPVGAGRKGRVYKARHPR